MAMRLSQAHAVHSSASTDVHFTPPCFLAACCHTQTQCLWRVQNFRLNATDLVPEMLCQITGISQQIGDIAVLFRGDIVVLDTTGRLWYIPVQTLPTTGSTNYVSPPPCKVLPLASLTGFASYTGLTTGYRSDVSSSRLSLVQVCSFAA